MPLTYGTTMLPDKIRTRPPKKQKDDDADDDDDDEDDDVFVLCSKVSLGVLRSIANGDSWRCHQPA